MYPLITISEASSDSGKLLEFLESITPEIGPEHLSATSGRMEVPTVSKGSPVLREYLMASVQMNGDYRHKVRHRLALEIPEPPPKAPPPSETGRYNIVSWDWGSILKEISTPLAMVCAAGGVKAFIDLLKAWVDERNGRRIKIKKGEIEFELQGGITETQVRNLVKMFEENFEHPEIITMQFVVGALKYWTVGVAETKKMFLPRNSRLVAGRDPNNADERVREPILKS